MISQDIRTLYVDSNWCSVDSDGSFRLDMFETIEVKEGMVAYVDDITIQGSMPHAVSYTHLTLPTMRTV